MGVYHASSSTIAIQQSSNNSLFTFEITLTSSVPLRTTHSLLCLEWKFEPWICIQRKKKLGRLEKVLNNGESRLRSLSTFHLLFPFEADTITVEMKLVLVVPKPFSNNASRLDAYLVQIKKGFGHATKIRRRHRRTVLNCRYFSDTI